MKKKIIPFIILLFFAILGYIFLKGHVNEFKNILQVNLKYVAVLFFLTLLSPLLKGLRLKMITQRYGLNLAFKEWFGLTILTSVGNYLSPFRAGGTAMAVYLKKRYKFPYTFTVSLTGTLYLIQFFIFGLLGFFLTVFTPFPKNIKLGVMFFFVIIFLISIFMIFFIPLPIRTDKKLLKHLANAISEFRRVRDLSFTLKSVFIDVLRVLVDASTFYLAFKAFNSTAPFTACALMSIFSGLSLIISLTPMGLGVQESSVVLTSKFVGANVLTSTFVAALDRVITIIIIFSLAPIFSYLIFKKQKHLTT